LGDSGAAELNSLFDKRDTQALDILGQGRTRDRNEAVSVGIGLYNRQNPTPGADALTNDSNIVSEGGQINFGDGGMPRG